MRYYCVRGSTSHLVIVPLLSVLLNLGIWPEVKPRSASAVLKKLCRFKKNILRKTARSSGNMSDTRFQIKYRDEHSAPFSWKTRSQQDLVLDSPRRGSTSSSTPTSEDPASAEGGLTLVAARSPADLKKITNLATSYILKGVHDGVRVTVHISCERYRSDHSAKITPSNALSSALNFDTFFLLYRYKICRHSIKK